MDVEEALCIARNNMTKPVDEIDLSMYSLEEKELINKATCAITLRVEALIEKNFIEKRGRF